LPELTTDDGVTIVYDDVGDRDGLPLVLCHGLAAAAEQMQADAGYFAAHGHRVLVPDLRAHGRSGRPVPLTRQSVSIARMAADLVLVLDHSGVAAVDWVGNSLGGILALHMLSGHEARLRSLATFGTAYRLSLPSWGGLIPLSYRLLGPDLVARFTAARTTRDTAARLLIEKLVRDHDPEVGGLIASNLACYDLIGNAQQAKLPILLIRGGRDVAVNAALGATTRAMRARENFKLVDLPEAGHCANLDARDAWRSALLEFWAGL
jgi:pimeloyl-ACP methyl ester carboxylesterase